MAKKHRVSIDNTSQQPTLSKVIAGGQTGAEISGLRAARACNVDTGGWASICFSTTATTTRRLESKFGLTPKGQVVSDDVPFNHSKANVDDSDATIVVRLHRSIEVDKLITYCAVGKWPVAACTSSSSTKFIYKPCFVIRRLPPLGREDVDLVDELVAFVRAYRVKTLHITGHRNQVPTLSDFEARVERLMIRVFTQVATTMNRGCALCGYVKKDVFDEAIEVDKTDNEVYLDADEEWLAVDALCHTCARRGCSQCLRTCWRCANRSDNLPHDTYSINARVRCSVCRRVHSLHSVCKECALKDTAVKLTRVNCPHHTWYVCSLCTDHSDDCSDDPRQCGECECNANYAAKMGQ